MKITEIKYAIMTKDNKMLMKKSGRHYYMIPFDNIKDKKRTAYYSNNKVAELYLKHCLVYTHDSNQSFWGDDLKVVEVELTTEYKI